MLFHKTQQNFDSLYGTHARAVQRFIHGMVKSSIVAEDLTQESFLKAWKALPQFGFKSSLKTWVYTVALNTTRDWLRSHKHSLEWSEAHETEAPEEKPETLAIRSALSLLNEDTRALLMLHYFEDLRLKEIAAILKIPEGTVKSRLFKAKKELQELLLKQGFDV